MELKSLLPTSETYSGATLFDAKAPQMFENQELSDKDIRFSRSNSSFRLTEEDENNMVDINEEEGQVMFSKKRTAPKTESALKELITLIDL